MADIKVRFAPSPTGWIHIGNIRTALFNYLWTKKMSGTMLLRIDDTDVARSKKEYEDGIYDVLNWLGIKWDEEARQSARVSRYNEVVEQLKKEGRIYACYDTPEELEFKRKRLMAKGLPPIYDRQALKYTPDDIKRFEDEGRKPHYRFKLVDTDIVWEDEVRGTCKYDATKLSDPIIIREDGSYLYHLPSVIDDVDFGITHIVRGEDHVTNTASQIQMFEAIGGKVPTFAHLPLLTGKEGKLSKRLGSIGIRELREDGIEAMAISSFLAKLGTSEDIRAFYSLDELAQTLDFDKIGRSQPKFDDEELRKFSTKLLHAMPYMALKNNFGVTQQFWDDVKGNLEKASDVLLWDNICNKEIEPKIEDLEFTTVASELLVNEEFSVDTFGTWMNALKEKTGRKGKDLFHPIRLALTAEPNGPELKTLLPLIGYDKAYKRLRGQKA